MSYIITYTGKKFHMLDPQPEDICIEDIAHALALTCRWGGHCDRLYSVAQHSYYVSEYCENHPLWGLLHDAAEAYIGDVPAPFKDGISNFRDIENNILAVIADKFGLPPTMPEEVHDVDRRIMVDEARILMGNPQWCHDLPNLFGGGCVTLGHWDSVLSETMFLHRFEELVEE